MMDLTMKLSTVGQMAIMNVGAFFINATTGCEGEG